MIRFWTVKYLTIKSSPWWFIYLFISTEYLLEPYCRSITKNISAETSLFLFPSLTPINIPISVNLAQAHEECGRSCRIYMLTYYLSTDLLIYWPSWPEKSLYLTCWILIIGRSTNNNLALTGNQECLNVGLAWSRIYIH